MDLSAEVGVPYSRVLSFPICFYGNRLKNAQVLAPYGLTLKPVDSLNDDGTIRLLVLTSDQLKTAKQIVLQKEAAERPTVVSIPAPDAKDAAKPTLTAQRRYSRHG